jgi:hypothetical protein
MGRLLDGKRSILDTDRAPVILAVGCLAIYPRDILWIQSFIFLGSIVSRIPTGIDVKTDLLVLSGSPN